MSKRQNFLPIFFFFLLLSFLFYALSQTKFGMTTTGIAELALRPLQQGVFTVYAATKGHPSQLQQLQEENAKLLGLLAAAKEQEKEIQALRDQFSITEPQPRSLLPAQIVGLKAFVPGVSLPEQVVINKGSKDNLKVGDAVVYKDILVGKISQVTDHLATVDLSFRKGFSITATTSQTNALGISKGEGQGNIVLENVVLSDKLQKDDLIITKGDKDIDSSGIPEGLVIGKIISIDKKASNLFQSAKVKVPIDITRVTTLFVLGRTL